MTVSTINTANAYSSDGATTTWAFTFQILSDSFGNPDTTTVALLFNGVQQTTGYTVAPNDDQESSPGGFVNFTAGAQPAGTQITIQRKTPPTQDTSFPLSAGLSTQALETALDKIVMIAQESAANAVAAFGLASPLPGVSTEWPTPIAGGIPVWNATANAIQYITPAQAHFVLTDNGVGLPASMQASSGGGGGGAVFGPITTTPFSLALWNNNSGTALSDGPALGVAGTILTSNGPGMAPSMQEPPLTGPVTSTNNTVALWSGTDGEILQDGPSLPAAKGLPLISGGTVGAARNAPLFSAPPPNAYYLSPSPHRRAMWWQALNNAATTLTAVGASALTAAVTITNNIVNGVGKFQNAQTSAVLNNSAGWISPTIDETNYGLNWTAAAHIYTGPSIATQRIWVGCVATDPVATDTLIDGAAFRYSTSAGDTTWKAVVGTGAASTVVDTGVVVAISKEYRFFIDASTPGTIYFWINEVLVATITTTLPGINDGVGPAVRIRTLAAAHATLGVGKFYLDTL